MIRAICIGALALFTVLLAGYGLVLFLPRLFLWLSGEPWREDQ